MKILSSPLRTPCSRPLILAACASLVLAACGGGADMAASSSSQVATGTTMLSMQAAVLPQVAALEIAQPFFHAAPALLQEPDDADASTPDASSHRRAHRHHIASELGDLPTRQLTVQDMQEPHRAREHHRQALQDASAAAMADSGSISAMAASTAIATYTPAQIRAAYGLPALPASTTGLSAAQAAQLGAGQTIYIVDAQHDPNAAAELAAFNTKFGLPACTTKAIAATTALPLPAASASSCEFAVVYSTAAGGLTATAPAYDAGWATEITLDVQWAHATAPLARIVLIEAADATLNSLLGGVKLANAMGPGIVSMSFGANEGSWTASVDAVFTGAGMSYLAATGDNGAAVSWPSVSSNVLAVGGTTLSYSGSGARSETGWKGTGGGVSAYTALPSYQSNAVPGMAGLARRAVADVAFNADPASGQYVAVQTPGSASVNWISVGGTSLSTPQWAGLIAIANAARAVNGKAALGAPHAALYGQIASVPGTYASAFADITQGSDGTCALCTAKAGYDPLTGLGTPNVGALLSTLTGAASTAAPVVTPAAISGTVGTALSFTASVTAPNPVTYTLGTAPAGMAISSTGVVTWPVPVLGTYSVGITAKDSKTGLSGQGTYTITIAQQPAPVVTPASISGTVGTALSYAVAVKASNPVLYSLSAAPAGMAISSSGVLSWASPVAGSYNVTVVAKDSKTGLSGQGVYTVRIAAAGPVITAAAMSGVVGKALSGTISIADATSNSLSISISGVPLGMTFAVSGYTINAKWSYPVAGSYNLKVVATDANGLSATTTIPVTVAAK